MSLADCQKEIDKWAQQHKVPYWKPHEMLTRLAEEVGELAREVNHEFGPKKKKLDEKDGDIGEELADIIVTVACMANALNIDLDEKFQKVIDKLYKRDKDRFEKKT